MKTRTIIAAAALALTFFTTTASTQDAEPHGTSDTIPEPETSGLIRVDAIEEHDNGSEPKEYKKTYYLPSSVQSAMDAVPELDEPEPVQTYAGTYELTAYIETGNPCADGVYPTVGYTAASNDPALWHKKIMIKGYGEYYVHDTGGMSINVIDLFFGSYDEAIQFGRREAEVYILE